MNGISYDVRIWTIETYRGTKVTTYTVRWKVGPRRWRRPFRIVAQADSFRAELLAAARRGEAFAIETGLPASWRRDNLAVSWYDFTCAYVDMKWKSASAKYRRAIAQALAAALPAMVKPTVGKPSDPDIRRAVLGWGYTTRLRPEAPADVKATLTWLARNTRPVSDLRRSTDARALLETAVTRLDGTRAAATSARRHRAVLFNALQYAVELGLLDANPVKDLRWTTPRASQAIDPRRVINPGQARALLAAVDAQQPSGPRLVAFFGVMYYCGLRPEEAVMLRIADLRLPADGGWGEMHVTTTAPDAGTRWTDSGRDRDRRGLKHRGEGEIRTVPIPPPQVRLFRAHLERYGASPDGHVFRGMKGGMLATITYRRAWDRARKAVFDAREYASPLARRRYDLRHACLSTWLNGGVAPAQVAEWAGHSVEVLLRTYVRCLDGQHDIAKRRIMEALDDPARDNGQFRATRAASDRQGHEGSVADRDQENNEDGDGQRPSPLRAPILNAALERGRDHAVPCGSDRFVSMRPLRARRPDSSRWVGCVTVSDRTALSRSGMARGSPIRRAACLRLPQGRPCADPPVLRAAWQAINSLWRASTLTSRLGVGGCHCSCSGSRRHTRPGTGSSRSVRAGMDCVVMTGSQRDRVIAACTAKPGSSVGDYPFGDEVAVVKLAGTMFALVALGPAPGSVSLKFDQDLAAGLRGRHATFTAGYHLNKRHWSTVTLDGSAPLIIQAAQVQEELGGGRWRVVDLIVTIPHESQ